MCGIIGVAGDLTIKDKRVFKELLIVDAIRGPHSTGVAAISNTQWRILKKAAVPHDLIDSQQYDSTLASNSHTLIGHNRYATTGRINSANAHPFEVGDIIGAHNGTLIRQSLLPDSDKFDVDSENIIYSINKQGIKETVANMYGSFALVYWNSDDSTLNMIRNDERPLCYCFSKSRETLYWASEMDMLYLILYRNDVEMGKPVELTPNELTSFTVPTKLRKKFDDPALNLLKEYDPPITVRENYHPYGWDGDTQAYDQQYLPATTKVPDKVSKRSVTKGLESVDGITQGDWINFNPGIRNQGSNYLQGYVDNKSMTVCRTHIWQTSQGAAVIARMEKHPWLIHRGKVQLVHKDFKMNVAYVSIMPLSVAMMENTKFVFNKNQYGTEVISAAWGNITKPGCFICSKHPERGQPIMWWEHEKEVVFICAPCQNELNDDLEKVEGKDIV